MTAISDRYAQLGGATGSLGTPMTSETALSDGVGRYNHFENGSIYWTPATGAHEIYGPIRERWAELRWERGILGYPTATPYREVRNRSTFLVALFQHGRIEVNSDTQQVYVEKDASAQSPNYSIPIVAYRVADNDGGRPCATDANGVRQWVDESNRVYAAAGIVFTYDGVLHELHDTDVNNLSEAGVESDPKWQSIKNRLNALAAQHRSVLVFFRFGPGTNSIGGGFSWWTYDFVAMSYFDANNLGVLPHELGHHFGLPHTHGKDFATVREAADYVLSRGPIEEIDGDRSLINDTPPDPFIIQLKTATDIQAITLGRQAFSFARKNIMSYWDHGGTGHLSHGQIDRVRQIVLERRGRYLNVTVITPVDCAALMNQIATLQKRLAELKAERDSETDPFRKREYGPQIVKVTNEISNVTNKAQSAECI